MHKAQGSRRVTIRLTQDAVRTLEEWAAKNLTSMGAEANRVILERAALGAGREKAAA